MKKHTKILSALLALVMVMALLPATALAANGEPPYSLSYLKGIEDNNYITMHTFDDEVRDGNIQVTQVTLEIYDNLIGYIASGGDWSQFIAPYRKAFRDAGFQERAEDNGSYSYRAVDGNVYDCFVIWSKEMSLSIINESSTVAVQHFVATYPEGTTSGGDQQTGGEPEQTVKPSLDNFKKSQTYSNQFTDVPAGEWYAPNVQAAYELGLMKGNSDTQFNPTGNISIAETLALACRIHSTYNTGVGDLPAASSGPWYQNYVDYALANNIMYNGQFTDYNAPANRAQFAMILASSLHSSALPAVNSVGEIPDVPSDVTYAWAVYRLYNAGVLAGSDEYGTFIPFSNISRAESAAIVTRMADPARRVKVELKPVPPVTLYGIGGRTVSVAPKDVDAYLAQGWSRTEKQYAPRNTPLRIYGQPEPSTNSADGVSYYIYWNSHRDKTIKYAHFYVTPYNNVGDVMTCDIRDYSNADGYVTGPISKNSLNTDWSNDDYGDYVILTDYHTSYNDKWEKMAVMINNDGTYSNGDGTVKLTAGYLDDVLIRTYWDCMWYNSDIKKIKITKVVLEYMDGSKETIQGSALDACFY